MRTLVLSCLASFVLAGCGDSLTVEDLEEELPAALCSYATRCGTFNAQLTEGECKTLIAGQLRATGNGGLEAAVEAGTVQFDEEKAADCLDQYEGLACGDDQPEDLCRSVVTGTVAEGQPCNITEECAGDDSFCVVGNACPGRCAHRAALGESCEDRPCLDDLYCDFNDGRCKTPVGEGESCVEADCAEGLVCKGPEGICRARDDSRKQAGESCDFSTRCADGLTCALKEGAMTFDLECTARAASGGACRRSITPFCPDDEFCELDEERENGTCKPVARENESCVTAACARLLVCVRVGETEEICATPKNNGEACRGDEECFSDTCVGGTCQAPPLCEPDEDEEPPPEG